MNTDDPAFWVKTDWPSKDLENKSVQFELTAPKMRVSGIGEFLVRTRPNGEQRIEIDVTLPEPYPTMVQRRFILRQIHADLIQRHPDQSVAEFQLLS